MKCTSCVSGCIALCQLNASTVFGGFLLVDGRWRAQAVGTTLLALRQEHVAMRNMGVNSPMHLIPHHAEKGFSVNGFKMHVLRGHVDAETLKEIKSSISHAHDVKMRRYNGAQQSFNDILAYDTKIMMHKSFQRPDFLRNLVDQSSETPTYIARLRTTNDICGYGCIQITEGGLYRVGPVYADSPVTGKRLIVKLFRRVPAGKQVTMDVLARNVVSMSFSEYFGWMPELTLRRIYSMEAVQLQLDNVFALSTIGAALI